EEALRLDWLGQVLGGAALQGQDRAADRSVAGDEHRARRRRRVAERLDERDPVLARELQVGQHQMERLAAEAVERVLGGRCGGNLVALGAEELRHRGQELRVVVNDENAGLNLLDGRYRDW